MIYLGIDNGISGALAAISDTPGAEIIAMLPMPSQMARGANEIDIAAVWAWLSELDSRDKITIIIEEPGGSKSSKAAKSMAGSFHALRALCVLKGFRWHRITPQSWQKVMLPGCKAKETKSRALATAKQLWPGETFLATPRSYVPHDGLVDAALIAEYARRARL